MARLEEITRGRSIRGILPEGLVSILDVKWLGTVAIDKDNILLGKPMTFTKENIDQFDF